MKSITWFSLIVFALVFIVYNICFISILDYPLNFALFIWTLCIMVGAICLAKINDNDKKKKERWCW